MIIRGRGNSSQSKFDCRDKRRVRAAMRRLIFGTIAVVGLLAMSAASAQVTSMPQPSFSGAPKVGDLTDGTAGPGWALLDPSRFKMRQSYSISYYSGSGSSGSVGLYMNQLEYQLFNPLTLRVGLGYLHQ